MPLYKFTGLTILCCLIIHSGFSQAAPMQVIKSKDLSKLWVNNEVIRETEGIGYWGYEPIGFIGQNYQRFFIHYNKILKREKPYEYEVYGKTRVKNNICPFIGTITIRKATHIPVDKADHGVGQLIKLQCDIAFFEDKKSPNSGAITGTMITYCYFDDKDNLQLASLGVGDGESMNEARAIWTAYKTGQKKKCKWGIWRIPDSGDLDMGAGEFYVNEKYRNNGWETYMNLHSDQETPQYKNALKAEKKTWWE